MPLRCVFSTSGYVTIVPSTPRTPRIDSSRVKRTKPSRIAGTPPIAGERTRHVGLGAQHPLALAVVAEATRLEHRGQADAIDGSAQAVFVVHLCERRGADAERVERRLLVPAIGGDHQRAHARSHRQVRGQAFHRRARHVLELVGHHVHRLPQALDHEVVLEAPDQRSRDSARGLVG